ncbi:MAG: hypothetical protein HYR96_12105 [Deltaproteobacteria bacterium]|nr:hypothetical protein [Deltaproteobacteria bacterium]
MKRSVFETLGGLRAVEFPNGFGDVAFNFDCHRRGLHNLYLGDITGTHRESASRGLSYEYWEEVAIETEYPDILQKMLRADVGFDRIPRPDFSFRQLKEIFVAALYRTFPRLLALRPAIRRLIASSRPPLALPSLTSTGE